MVRSPRVLLFALLVGLTATACFSPGGTGGGTGGAPGGGTAPPAGGGTPPGGGGGTTPPGSGTGDQNGSLGTCPGFPPDGANYVGWGVDVSTMAADPNSANYVTNILANGGDYLHPDFGGGGDYGIPYVTVPGTQTPVPVTWTAYGNQSDPGPYKTPLGAPIEGGAASSGDRHVISIDRDNCILYELYRAFPQTDHWDADSGVDWDLRSSALRTPTWTSADTAGLPIFPGLVRYDEIAAGVINHALRFTVNATRHGYVLPATHWASDSTDANRPPMGLRLRLSAAYDIAGFTGQSRVILEALKKYGMIVADNGSNWYITGAADSRFDDDDLDQLKTVPGSAFEVVDTGDVCTTEDGSQPQSVCGP